MVAPSLAFGTSARSAYNATFRTKFDLHKNLNIKIVEIFKDDVRVSRSIEETVSS